VTHYFINVGGDAHRSSNNTRVKPIFL